MFKINGMLLIQVVSAVYLGLLAGVDIRERKIPIWMLAAGGAAAAVYQLAMQKVPIVLVLSGAAVGMVFLAVSRGTKEAFGYGDSLLILVLGIYLGFWSLLYLLAGAFFLSALFAAAVLAYRKFKRKTSYPFIPFLAIAYFTGILLGGF